MSRYFPLTKTRTVTVEVPVGDGSAVETERLQYDNRNTAKRAIDTVSADVEVMEAAKRAIESVTAAFAAEITETGQRADEAVSVVVAPKIDEAKRAEDTTSVVGQVAEMGKRADDTIQAIVIPTADQAKRAVEDISNTVTATANELGQRADESVSAIAEIMEAGQRADDTVTADVVVMEMAKRAVEDISNTVTGTANEVGKRASDSIEAAIIAKTELGQKAADTEVVQITLNGYANQNVSNTGWTNQGNILGNTTGTSASLTATASGLLGTTNNTTNGTTVLGFRDVSLGDLTITSVILSAENSGAGAGVAIVQPTANIQYQYSTNNGGTWTTFYTHNTATLAKGIRTIDLTAIIGQDQTLINNFQVRATGSVTSGTGVGAAYTASFFRTWITLLANRTY